MKKRAVDMIMDSGAYSAWKSGAKIDFKDYAGFLLDHASLLFAYINLDTIPGSATRRPDSREVEAAAKASYANQQRLKGMGLHPMPVFHQGESWKWLERMVDEEEPYVGIATLKNLTSGEHQVWLDQVFNLITNRKGDPVIKTHGLGITNVNFMVRYPWYSVDSSTWQIIAGGGSIIVPSPYIGSGIAPYFQVYLSGEKGHRLGLHAMSRYYRDLTQRFLKRHNLSLDRLPTSVDDRRRAVLHCLRETASMKQAHKFKHQSHHGFEDRWPFDDHPGARIDRLHYFYVTKISDYPCGPVMMECGAREQLTSFYHFAKNSGVRDQVAAYIRTGLSFSPTGRGRMGSRGA